MDEAYVHVPNVLVRCINGCGGYLGARGDETARVEGQDDATRFSSDTQGWQAAMQAGWGNVPPPDHVAHDRPLGQGGRTIRCDAGGVGDCEEVRAYRFSIVCPSCRAAGWQLPAQDRSGGRS